MENWERKQRRGKPAWGLGENSFNSSVGSENALLLKYVAVGRPHKLATAKVGPSCGVFKLSSSALP